MRYAIYHYMTIHSVKISDTLAPLYGTSVLLLGLEVLLLDLFSQV